MKIKEYLSDPIGLIWLAFRMSWVYFVEFFSTVYCRVLLLMMGVKIGNKCGFSLPLVCVRHPQTVISIGSNCFFNSKENLNLIGISHRCIIATCKPGAQILIGDNCQFSGVSMTSFESISIDDNVKVGPNSIITDSDWHPEDPRSGKNSSIHISSNVWIGMNVTVLKGVEIGENSMIGSNSVVTRSIPANVIAAGNPCKVIRELNIGDYQNKHSLIFNKGV